MRRAPESIVDHGERELDVLRDTVDPNSLNHGIDLMSSSRTLTLLDVEHDVVLYLHILIMAVSATNSKLDSHSMYLVVKPTAFRIRKHDENVIRHRLQEMACAGNRTARPFRRIGIRQWPDGSQRWTDQHQRRNQRFLRSSAAKSQDPCQKNAHRSCCGSGGHSCQVHISWMARVTETDLKLVRKKPARVGM